MLASLHHLPPAVRPPPSSNRVGAWRWPGDSGLVRHGSDSNAASGSLAAIAVEAHPPAPPPAGSTAARRSPNRLAPLILLAFSLGSAVLAAELALRLVRPQFTLVGATFYTTDPDPWIGFRLRPGHDGVLVGVGEFRTRVRVNELGLRGGPPEEGQPRVLGVGDSFVFGWGVEEDQSFLALASREAGAAPLNAGVPNYSLCQSAALAERLLPRLAPRMVVVAAFAGNDELDETVPVASYRIEDGRLRAHGEAPKGGWRRALRAVTDRSHLLRAARSSSLGDQLGRTLGAPPPARERLLRHALLTYADPPPPEIAAAGERIAACLRLLRERAGEAGAEVFALILPADLAVVPGALEATAAELGEPGRRYLPIAPRDRLTAVMRGAGVPYLDLHEPLAQAARTGGAPYYPHDRHLTPAGHALVASLLAPRVAAALAAPPAEPP
jgi:hypothetical protein